MSRREDCRVNASFDRDDVELDDPDFVIDYTYWSDSINDAVWSHLLPLVGEDMLLKRRRQKSQLARYGRQSVLQWATLPVDELDDAYAGIAEIVEQENELSRNNEDR